jgi:hypothetical protein
MLSEDTKTEYTDGIRAWRICDDCDEQCEGTDEDKAKCVNDNPDWLNDRC